MNQANNAAFPKSKQSNAAKPNPIKTTFGISAFSNSSAGRTSLPFEIQGKEMKRKKNREKRGGEREKINKNQ